VPPAHTDVVKWSDIVMNGDGDAANHDYGSEEPYRGEKKPFAASLRKLPLVNRTQAREKNDKCEQPENSGDDERPDPKAAVRPRHSNVTLLHACDVTDGVNQALGGVSLGLR
jgi:hypothetical protein